MILSETVQRIYFEVVARPKSKRPRQSVVAEAKVPCRDATNMRPEHSRSEDPSPPRRVSMTNAYTSSRQVRTIDVDPDHKPLRVEISWMLKMMSSQDPNVQVRREDVADVSEDVDLESDTWTQSSQDSCVVLFSQDSRMRLHCSEDTTTIATLRIVIARDKIPFDRAVHEVRSLFSHVPLVLLWLL